MFAEINVPEPALGAAMSAAVSALVILVIFSFNLQEKFGGKISVLLSSLPTWGPGSLRFRDTDPNVSGTEREVIFLQPGDGFYPNLGQRCVEHGIGVDLFIMSSMYADIATIGNDPYYID